MDVLTEQIGKFQFTVATCEPTQEPAKQRDYRVDALTRWLLAEWEREQGEDDRDDRHLLN